MTVTVMGAERAVDMERGFEIWVGGRLVERCFCSYEAAWERMGTYKGATLRYRLLPQQ